VLVFVLAMDISADLTELGRTPVAVVCAGVKSILDIGRTLEYLVRRSFIEDVAQCALIGCIGFLHATIVR